MSTNDRWAVVIVTPNYAWGCRNYEVLLFDTSEEAESYTESLPTSSQREVSIVPAKNHTTVRKQQVDPPDCGCTECLTGEYRTAVDWDDYFANNPDEKDWRG